MSGRGRMVREDAGRVGCRFAFAYLFYLLFFFFVGVMSDGR